MQKFDSDFSDFNSIQIDDFNKEEIIDKLNELKDKISSSSSEEECVKSIRDYFKLSDTIATIRSVIYIRHSQDVSDEKYTKLNDYLDENYPFINKAENDVLTAIYNSPFKEGLEKEFSPLFFKQIELSLKTISDEVLPLLQEENRLISQYIELKGKAKVEYEGELYSLAQIAKFTSSPDREIREETTRKSVSFYDENDEKIGEIFSSMIKVRNEIALKLGYEDFVQLGYDRMGRLDWTYKDAREYRNKVFKYIVPLSNEIFNKQKDRLGYGEDTKFFDYNIFYKTGNPTPKYDADTLVRKAEEMYEKMSPVLGKYFSFMVQHNCMDLIARPNKVGGGFMDYLPMLKTSFIFANFNSTPDDIDTLTHEFGHSIQGFLAGERIDIPSYRSPSLECCEMHSMSMEYLTYPFMNMFFEEEADKYRYFHLASAITFIPYGCIIDAFQEYCYQHPYLNHNQRKAYFRSLEKKFLPHLDYEGFPAFESGAYFERQSHIFENPFYYLDYTIATIVALDFFKESMEDYSKTLDKYINFCYLGGKYPFRELLKEAGINNPMDNDTLKDVSQAIYEYLKTFDVSSLDK